MADRQAWQLGQLDALRGLAVCGVLVVHTAYLTKDLELHLSPLLENLTFAGQRGVQLFYILSAFTLAMSHDRRRARVHTLISFVLRRFFRIAPMFYVALLLTRFLAGKYSGTRTAHVLALTFTNGFHPIFINLGAAGGWSVADEAIFYGCLPLMLLWVRSVRSAALTLFLTALVSKIAIFYLVQAWPLYTEYWAFTSIIAELPVFLSGLLIYQVWKSLSIRENRHRDLSLALLTISALLFFLLMPFSDKQLLPESFAVALFVLALAFHPWRFFVNRLTIFLGKISFSVYLLHFYIYFPLERVLRPHLQTFGDDGVAILTFVLGTALVIPLATLTWLLVERPGIALGARLIALLEDVPQTHLTPLPLSAKTDSIDAQF